MSGPGNRLMWRQSGYYATDYSSPQHLKYQNWI